MKAVAVLIVVVYAALAVASTVNRCPEDQKHDWTINFHYEHETYCNKFYHCAHGYPIAKFCPHNLLFDEDIQRCEWPHLVDCRGKPILPPPPPNTTTTSTTSTTSSTTPSTTTSTTTPSTTTPSTTTSTTTPSTTTSTTTPSTTTSSTTPSTTTSTTTPSTTTSTTTPSTTTSTTTPSTTTSTTTSTTSTTTTPSSTTSGSTSSTTREPPILRPNGCPVDPHIHWLIPHETDCNLFYYCVWGERALRRCNSALHFNRVLQVCDWPVRAGCPT